MEQILSFVELQTLVIQWAEQRNIIKGATPKDQMLKLVSEFGELEFALMENDYERIRAGFGDVTVCMIVLSAQMGTPRLDEYVAHNHQLHPHTNAWPPMGMLADCVAKGMYGEAMQHMSALCRAVGNMLHMFNAKATLVYANRNELHWWTPEYCLQHAYNEIKDRVGVMYNGVYIKNTDTRYISACHELGIEPILPDA